MPLHIVTGCTPDMALMNEELFGPILPVPPYDSLDEAIAYINARPRPLALYCFSHDSAERDALLWRTHSGGVSVNDWGWHVINHDAPFGGIGNSGMGTYHGVEGFRELSQAKTMFQRQRLFPTCSNRPTATSCSACRCAGSWARPTRRWAAARVLDAHQGWRRGSAADPMTIAGHAVRGPWPRNGRRVGVPSRKSWDCSLRQSDSTPPAVRHLRSRDGP